MKRLFDLLGWIGVAAIVSVLSVGLGAFWFGLWMDRGWPGATGLLGKIFRADGEYAYDAMQYEMTIWCFILIVVLFLFGLRIRRHWRRNRK